MKLKSFNEYKQETDEESDSSTFIEELDNEIKSLNIEGVLNESIIFTSNIYKNLYKIYEGLSKEEILKFFSDVDDTTAKCDYARLKALLWIYHFQTEDEKKKGRTAEFNSVGFTGSDGELLTSFAKQLITRAFLSPKQMGLVRKKISKYAGQIAKLINSNEIDKTSKEGEYYSSIMANWWKENKNKYTK